MASESVPAPVQRLFNRTRRRDKHPTTAAVALNVTRQVDRALPPPAGDQSVERLEMARDQGTWGTSGLERKQTPDPGPDCPWQRQQPRHLDLTGPDLGAGRSCELVEGIGVLTQQISRTCQCRNGSRPELGLQQGQQGTCANPSVCRVAVVRVHPRREPGRLTGGHSGRPGQAEKRTDIGSAAGRHTGEGPRPGAPGETEQNLLGLVVPGVAKEDGHGAEPLGRLTHGLVSRVPRPSLGAGAGQRDQNRHDLDRVERKPAALVRGTGGHGGRAGLQTVVDDHGARGQARPGTLESDGCGERQRVRATTAGDQDQPTLMGLRDRSERLSDGDPSGCDGRMRSGHRCQPIIRGRAGPRRRGSRSPRAAAGSRVRSTRR